MSHIGPAPDGNLKFFRVKALGILRNGWKQMASYPWMWLALCFLNLAFALVAVIPMRSWLKNIAGHSLSLEQSIGRFDFTFITDLLRNNEGLSIFFSQIGILLIVYLIFSAFLVGGFLYVFVSRPAQVTVSSFLIGGANYFWRIFRLALCFLGIQSILLGIVFLIINAMGMNPMDIESDVVYIRYLKVILVVYLLCALFVTMLHVYAKVFIVREDMDSVFKAIGKGFRFVWLYFGTALGLYVASLFILLCLFFLNANVKAILPSNGSAGILPAFFLAQVFLFARVGVKLLIHSSALTLVELRGPEKVTDGSTM